MSTVVPSRSGRPPGPQRRMSLSAVTNQAVSLPSRIIIYGSPGIGKTSLAAAFPDPVFVMTSGETGLLTLMGSGQIGKINHFPEQAKSWNDVLEAIDELVESDHTHKTLVLDTLNGSERLCHELVCARDYNNNWAENGFIGFQRGERSSVNDWRQLLFKLDTLRETKRMGIILLCHAKISTVKNAMGADYDTFMPALGKETWNVTVGWSDIVLFAKQEVYVKEARGKSLKKASTGDRVLLTEGEASFEAKNRHGLPSSVNMGDTGQEGYANLMEAFRASKKNNNNNSSTTPIQPKTESEK